MHLTSHRAVEYDDNDPHRPNFPMPGEESMSSGSILFDITTSVESTSSTAQATSGPQPQQHEGQDTDSGRETQATLKPKYNNSAAFDKKSVFSWFAAIPNDSEAYDSRFQDSYLDQHNVAGSNNVKVKRNLAVDDIKIRDILAKMHSSLSISSFQRCGEYRSCPSSTVEEVNETLAWLRNDEGAHHQRDRSAPSQRHGNYDRQPQGLAEYDDIQESHSTSNPNLQDSFVAHQGHAGLLDAKIKFVHTMKALFETFLPIDYTSEMVAKYWGAVKFLLQVCQPYIIDGRELY